MAITPKQLLNSKRRDDESASRVDTPDYDRSQLRPSIVHIGVGAFHRSHLATYIHELCQLGNTDWGIVGSGVLPQDATIAKVLSRQDCLYTLITRGPQTFDVEIIGSIIGYIHASPDVNPLIEAIARPSTQIVSLTITEGGYPLDDLTGQYQASGPTAGPRSAIGILAAGLRERQIKGGGPVTIISCDNIIGNGNVTRAVILGEAERLGGGLAEWIDESVSFPNSMVDRITPSTTEDDRTWLAETYNLVDGWPVVAEPFRQWVIEDNFAGERLPLEDLDVLVTDDVEPYELMKLRMLNAGHSCLAYLAAIDGFLTVDEALADDALRHFVASFLTREAQPVLNPVPGIDPTVYTTSIIERFSNPNIGDHIARLCLDGSAKFPKFLLPTIERQLDVGGPVELAALALAGWCQYLTQPQNTLASDPLLDKAVVHAARSKQEPLAFLEFDEVFHQRLRQSARFRAAFSGALKTIRHSGVQVAINQALKGSTQTDDRRSH